MSHKFRNLLQTALSAIIAACLLWIVSSPTLSRIESRIAKIDHKASTALAQANEKPKPQPEPVIIEERIIELPEDGSQWHTILILRPEWQTLPAERKARTAFYSQPGLVSLREQTHWHQITTDRPEFKPFAPLVDITPCLILERPNGQVVYREAGPQLGEGASALRCSIQKEIDKHCPNGKCLPLHPVPGPAPVEPIPEVLREAPPEKKAADRNMTPAILMALAAAAGSVAVAGRRGY